MTLERDASQEPPKLSFTNLRNGTELLVQFNPVEFEEQLAANYGRLQSQGNSHQQLQFANTNNFKVVFELEWVARSRQELTELRRARRILMSWHYPRTVANDIVGGGPPSVLMVWPGMLTLEIRSMSVRLKHKRFNGRAKSVWMFASLTIEEFREFRLTDDEVENDNQFRLGSDDDLEDFLL